MTPSPTKTRSRGRRSRVLVLVALTLATFLAGPPLPPGTRLRVMTFNIHAGHGDLVRTAQVIGSARPDVVALQEVDVHWGDRSGFMDQAAALGAATGMDVRFGPIYRLPGASPEDPPREYGVAVLSRLPVTAWRNHAITRLSTQGDDAPRPMPGFLQVTVVMDGRELDVFSTHLDFRPDPAVRRTQVAEMLALVDGALHPVILLGDLNAPPDADELQPLLQRLRDAWSGAAPSSTGWTYPAQAPLRRIDYVLISPELAVRGAEVVPTDASDHLPVLVELEIPRR